MDLLQVLHRAQEHCACCGIRREDLLLCPCRGAYYCSTSCQLQHWKQHKGSCTKAEVGSEPKLKQCYYCGRGSFHLRSCQCGLVLYCDVVCQGKHWVHHRPLCSTWALPEQQRPDRLGRVRRMDAQVQTDPLMFEPEPLFARGALDRGAALPSYYGEDAEARARRTCQQLHDDAVVAVLATSDAGSLGAPPEARRATMPLPAEYFSALASARGADGDGTVNPTQQLAASDRSAVGFSGRELRYHDDDDELCDMGDLKRYASKTKRRDTTASTDSNLPAASIVTAAPTDVFECSGLMDRVVPRPTTSGSGGGELSVHTDTDHNSHDASTLMDGGRSSRSGALQVAVPPLEQANSTTPSSTDRRRGESTASNPLVAPHRTSVVLIDDRSLPSAPTAGGSGGMDSGTSSSFYRTAALGSTTGSFVLQQQQPLTRKGTVMSTVLHGAAAHLSRSRSGVFGAVPSTVSWGRSFEGGGGGGSSVLGNGLLDSPYQRELVLQQEEFMMDEEECRSDIVHERRSDLVAASSVLQRVRFLYHAKVLGREEDAVRIAIVTECNLWLRTAALPAWRHIQSQTRR